jgi:hypothetical protein
MKRFLSVEIQKLFHIKQIIILVFLYICSSNWKLRINWCGEEVAQTMYTHVSKCKSDKIKKIKRINCIITHTFSIGFIFLGVIDFIYINVNIFNKIKTIKRTLDSVSLSCLSNVKHSWLKHLKVSHETEG